MIPYLQLDNLSKNLGRSTAFRRNILNHQPGGEKVALIAKNGAGKTTLMNILSGDEVADSGKILFSPDIRVGYLRQMPDLNPDETVLEAAFSSSGQTITAVREYESALESHNPKAIERAMDKINHLNCWDFELKIKQILTELNIHDLQQPIRELSGGQKKPGGAGPRADRRTRLSDPGRAHQPPRPGDDRMAGAHPRKSQMHPANGHPRPLLPRQGLQRDRRARRQFPFQVQRQLLLLRREAERQDPEYEQRDRARPEPFPHRARLAQADAAGPLAQIEVPDRERLPP